MVDPRSIERKGHILSYDEIKALTFQTIEEMEAAIRMLWSNEFRGLPHDIAEGNTLILPAEVIPCLGERGLKFTEMSVLTPNDLSSEEVADLRHQQSIF